MLSVKSQTSLFNSLSMHVYLLDW